METKALEASPDNKSNTRTIAAYGIAGAFLLCLMILVAGLFLTKDPNVVSSAAAAGTLFLTVTGPFMILLGHNKRQEVKEHLEKK